MTVLVLLVEIVLLHQVLYNAWLDTLDSVEEHRLELVVKSINVDKAVLLVLGVLVFTHELDDPKGVLFVNQIACHHQRVEPCSNLGDVHVGVVVQQALDHVQRTAWGEDLNRE